MFVQSDTSHQSFLAFICSQYLFSIGLGLSSVSWFKVYHLNLGLKLMSLPTISQNETSLCYKKASLSWLLNSSCMKICYKYLVFFFCFVFWWHYVQALSVYIICSHFLIAVSNPQFLEKPLTRCSHLPWWWKAQDFIIFLYGALLHSGDFKWVEQSLFLRCINCDSMIPTRKKSLFTWPEK